MIISTIKPRLDFTYIRESAYVHQGRFCGRLGDTTVHSAFQPIYSLVHARMVGAEGLMRCVSAGGAPISPMEMLHTLCRNEVDAVHLDRLCRYLHIQNAAAMMPEPCWLFLNVSPRIVIAGRQYGAFFRDLLLASGLAPSRIVVEILEDSIQEESQLHKAVDYFRELGCVIAIDDFGTGHSNFSRVWEISPDIVKLDKSLVMRSSFDRRIMRTLPNLVDLLHESGCHVLMEGIENEQEAAMAVSAGVDMVQGYYFAKPAPDLQQCETAGPLIRAGHAKYIHMTRDKACSLAYMLKPYIEVYMEVLARGGFSEAIDKLLALPHVLRCYALDDKGRQIGTSSLPVVSRYPTDEKFAVLANGEGADWSTRKYFRTAINNPGQVQISEEYFSIPDGGMCITLSVACQWDKAVQVFCCDLNCDCNI